MLKEPAHETSDANAKGLAIFGLSLLLGLVLIQFCVVKVFFALKRKEASLSETPLTDTSLRASRQGAPAPHLQSNPAADLQAYLSKENHLLSTYEWVDRDQSIARIPISRAMDLLSGGRP